MAYGKKSKGPAKTRLRYRTATISMNKGKKKPAKGKKYNA